MSRATTNDPANTGLKWEAVRPQVTGKLLAGITRRIVERFKPHKVILFGSYVWGDPNIHSDLDLFVLMDSQDEMIDRMVQVATEAEVRFLPMDVLVYTPKELRDRLAVGDPFFHDIVNRGRVLYDRGTG